MQLPAPQATTQLAEIQSPQARSMSFYNTSKEKRLCLQQDSEEAKASSSEARPAFHLSARRDEIVTRSSAAPDYAGLRHEI